MRSAGDRGVSEGPVGERAQEVVGGAAKESGRAMVDARSIRIGASQTKYGGAASHGRGRALGTPPPRPRPGPPDPVGMRAPRDRSKRK